ncbi:MAG: FAD-binding oxidoreductase, partial [Proteobacteria bacterium]|nr:FAD-binding oxidoreductase [Pseudomonadota bacterium]
MKKIDGFLAQLALFLKPEQIGVDLETRNFYAQDWSRSLTPDASAVVFPESTGEVSKVLALAHSFEIPVVPSGGRTGLSGGAVATKGEVVLSLIRMNRMGPVHEGALTLKAGAGAITEAVHQHCAPY